jgi:hypothetical protein
MGGAVRASADYIQVGNYISRYDGVTGLDVPGLVPFNGNIQHVVLYNDVLTTTNAALLGKALIGFRGEGPRTRISSLLDLVGMDASFVGGDSTATLGAIDLGGSLLSELQITATSEAGALATNAFRTGVTGISQSSLTFWGRYSQDDGTSIGLTDDITANPALNIVYVADRFEIQYDDKFLVNECRVTGANGIEYTAKDTTSQTAYGVRARSIDTRLDTLAQVRSYAEWVVSRYASPAARAGRIVLRPQRDPSNQWPLALGLDLLESVTVTRTPTSGSAISLDCLVDGLEHRLSAASGEWEITVTASPRDPNLDDAALHWVLGTSSFDDETVLYF